MMLAKLSLKYDKNKKRKYRTGIIYHFGEYDFVIHTPFNKCDSQYKYVATEITTGWMISGVGGNNESTCANDLCTFIKHNDPKKLREKLEEAKSINKYNIERKNVLSIAKVIWIK